jgi:hypothetical protein
MSRRISYKNISGFYSIFFILLFIAGMHTYFNQDYHKLFETNYPYPEKISVSQSRATLSSGFQITLLQNRWIPNDAAFKQFAFSKTQYSENKETDLKISCCERARNESADHQMTFIQYHLFPDNREDIPDLG